MEGLVSGPGAVPAQGVFVGAYTPDGHLLSTATSGPDGRYSLAVAPSTVKIVAADPHRRFDTTYFGGSSFATAAAIDLLEGHMLSGLDLRVEAMVRTSFRHRPATPAASSSSDLVPILLFGD